MALDVFDGCAGAKAKSVDAVMLGEMGRIGVDAAAGHNGDMAVFADKKIVVDEVLEVALAEDDGDVDEVVFGVGFDANIDAGLGFFDGDFYGVGAGYADIGLVEADAMGAAIDVGGAVEGVDEADFDLAEFFISHNWGLC